ncbi:HEAT repeat domain-containing protein [Variovorax sp. J22P168]|uniref:HEAT repeat domain-containing protein n=1 Tax=Variovorax jilinensis TaxID=3053513 RepID=UPI00257767DA|nr:HEAT repeat domain-containing protein [Variovorax sp. J22P168]MDM0011753.1 HEAT repeat domain-containing protein [Variovorax sp. J22P168]
MSSTSAEFGGLDAASATERASALAALVVAGRASTPTLLRALASADPEVREKAAQGLAEIADPRAADALAAALADAEPKVRGRAAQGLASIGDPRALDALVRTIDDFPDLLHAPHTVATYVLIARGRDVLPSVAPLLDAPLPMTRQRAFAVVQALVSAMPDAGDWATLWRSLGSYDPNGADETARRAAAAQWARWIAVHCP